MITGMMARRIAASASFITPNDISGLTYWINGTNAATLFTDDWSTCVSSDGDRVFTVLSDGSDEFSARRFSQPTLALRPIYKTGAINGKSVLDFSTSGTRMQSVLGEDNFYSTTGRTVVAAAYFPASSTTNGTNWGNSPLICGNSSSAQATGIFFKSDAGTQKAIAYNYDGSADQAITTFPNDTWAVLSVRHTGSNIQIRFNRGAWTTVASGTNTILSAVLFLAYGTTYAAHYPTKIAHLSTFNVSISDTDLASLEDYFADQIGITLP